MNPYAVNESKRIIWLNQRLSAAWKPWSPLTLLNTCLSKLQLGVLMNLVNRLKQQIKKKQGRGSKGCVYVSHTIQQVLSWEELWSSWALNASLLSDFASRDPEKLHFCWNLLQLHWALSSPGPACAFRRASPVLAGLSDKRDIYRTPLPVGFLLLWDQLRAQAGLGDQITAHPAAKWTLITCLRTFRFSSSGSLCHPELECNYSYLLWLAAHELLSCTSSTIWHLFVPN